MMLKEVRRGWKGRDDEREIETLTIRAQWEKRVSYRKKRREEVQKLPKFAGMASEEAKAN